MIQEAWNGNLVSKHTVAVTVGEVKKILGEFGPWISYRPRMGYCFEAPHADDLVRQGWHCWNRGTREGFEKALCYFQRAARESNDPRAFEGSLPVLHDDGHLRDAARSRNVPGISSRRTTGPSP